jgi:hypothetical protein
MNFKSVLASALFVLASTLGCEASTYNLALWSNGVETGTGLLTINSSVPTTGPSTFTQSNGLGGLSFAIGGTGFSLGSEVAHASVSFSNGNLASIFYIGISNGFQFALGTIGLDYGLLNLANGSVTSGTITDPVATPLPSSWTLMLLGLVGAGFVAYRRKNGLRVAAI